METGETETTASPGFAHQALGSDFMPESAVLESTKLGDRRYAGRVSVGEYDRGQHRVSFEASYEIELPDPCAAAAVEIAGGESEAAAAFGALYRMFTPCDFEGMAEHLVPELSDSFLAELRSDTVAVETLKQLMGSFPREVILIETVRDGDEVTVSTELGPSMEEITLRLVGGEWKVVSGFLF